MVRRHDLVKLAPQGWDQVLRGLSGPGAAMAMTWRDRDLPAVVRRTEPGTPPGVLCLGIPAPPDALSGRKLRVGFTAEAGHVAAVRPPLALAEIVAPPAWRAAVASLDLALRDADLECHVFGSVAMQTLTGDPYLSSNSDIDLLLRPANAGQLGAGLRQLERHAALLPLDGEIEFPSGHAVSWKEWLSIDAAEQRSGARVLAKHLDTVALVRCDALLAQLDGDAHG
jgi:phosphoribosyl-dephospho-CoA transferase